MLKARNSNSNSYRARCIKQEIAVIGPREWCFWMESKVKKKPKKQWAVDNKIHFFPATCFSLIWSADCMIAVSYRLSLSLLARASVCVGGPNYSPILIVHFRSVDAAYEE